MFDPDYNMTPPFFSTATNILLIKCNLKFESRATAVFVAMSPRYLGGKYRSRLHPRINEVDHAVFLKAEFQMHTVLSNKNGKFYTIMIYPCFSMFFDGIACLIKVWP